MARDGLILVVEDDQPIAELLAVVLESEGYHGEIAATGREALEQLSGGAFRLVILDLHLPDMDGREVLRAIRESPTTKDLPVIVVTGYPFDPGVSEATAVVAKPPDIMALVATIGHALGSAADRQT